MRRSGRTTRMVQAAVLEAMRMHQVRIYFHHPVMVNDFRHIFGRRIDVRVLDGLFEWMPMRVPGLGQDTIYFVDHYACELEAAKIRSRLDELRLDVVRSAYLEEAKGELEQKKMRLLSLLATVEREQHRFDLPASVEALLVDADKLEESGMDRVAKVVRSYVTGNGNA